MKKNPPTSLGNMFLVTLFVILALICNSKMSLLREITEDLHDIENLSSGTQRLIRLVLMGEKDEKFLYYVDSETELRLKTNQELSLAILDDSYYYDLANNVLKNWEEVYDLLADDYEGVYWSESLQVATEHHFDHMTTFTQEVTLYATDLSNTIFHLQYAIIGVLIVGFYWNYNHFLELNSKYRHSQNLAQFAALDTATGLYNRSKCQDLFRQNSREQKVKTPAVMVLDLNDLKKTNDSLGHRVGDDLIHQFSTLLKEACSVHLEKPFVGRYGGDEFVVYHENVIGVDDLEVYLKELKFLVDKHNERETRFQISYAVGYAVQSTEESDGISVRDLFDKADEAMYENKILVKKAREESTVEKVEA